MIFIKDNLKLLNKKELIKFNIIILITVTCLLLEVVIAGLVYPLITSLCEDLLLSNLDDLPKPLSIIEHILLNS